MKKLSVTFSAISLVLVLALLFGAGCNLIFGASPAASPPATNNITPTAPEKPATPEAPPIPKPLIPPVSAQTLALPSIADVVAKVKPSVVAINTEITLVDFFNRSRSQESAGSGWIIRPDGIIITNNHVVENARTISVTLDDGRTFPVDLKTIATDPLTDLAVLKINAMNLPAARVGDSAKMRVGDWVVAIGNSLGEGIRATQGIISRQNASVPVDSGQTLYGLIETDAAINPGNSGGPLVNLDGEVIGITSAKLAAVGIEATGFAISAEAAMPVIQQLIATGRAVHPWLGVSLFTIDQVVIQTYELAVDQGALVVEVAASSPADTAGLQVRDVIVGFAGREIKTVDNLIQAIRQAQVGQKVEIVYWRGQDKKTTSATLIERPR